MQNVIKRKYIVTSAGGAAGLPRALALCGRDSFALCVVSPTELAAQTLARRGADAERLLSRYSMRAVVLDAMKDNGYFDETVGCARIVCRALNNLRGLLVCGSAERERELIAASLRTDDSAGIFAAKNRAIIKIYDEYTALCARLGCTDSAGLLRAAFAALSDEDSSDAGQNEYIELAEFPLSPLERAFIDRLAGGGLRTVSLAELFGADSADGSAACGALTCGYGENNECERVLSRIAEERLPLDSCVVAVTDPRRYAQIFYDIACRTGIAMTFGCGVPVSSAAAGELLEAVCAWALAPSPSTLREVIFSSAFDRAALKAELGAEDAPELHIAAEAAGRLGLLFDGEENRRRIKAALEACRDDADDDKRNEVLAAERLSAVLEKGWAYIIEHFSVVRQSSPTLRVIDSAARDTLADALGELEAAESTRASIAEVVPELLGRMAAQAMPREGTLYITSLEGAMLCGARKLFVCGLAASLFPGEPREDAILLDCDLESVAQTAGIDRARLPLSDALLTRRAERLGQLAAIYAARGDAPRLSYSGYDLCEHKEENPSAAFFKLWNAATGGDYGAFTAAFEQAGFFGADVSPLYGIETAPKKEEAPAADETDGEAQPEAAAQPDGTKICADLSSIKLSPSAYEQWRECPRKYMLRHMLSVAPPEQPKEWLDAAEFGTLLHEVMELSANKNYDERQFMALAEERFERFAALCPPAFPPESKRKRFIDIARRAFRQDPGAEVAASEMALEAVYEGDDYTLTLRGRADRVEKDGDGCVLVDYKTGSGLKHFDDDHESCVQVLMYSYILEKAHGMKVSEGQFRYPALDTIVHCRWDDSARASLKAALDGFAAAVRSGDFPERNNSDKHCRYCEYAQLRICGNTRAQGEGE